MYRRDAFHEVDWYKTELGSWSDTFAARAIGLKYGACYIADVVYLFRRLSTSYSGKSRANPRHTLDIVARAARLMRSDEFQDRFPEEYVRQWERKYRLLTMWNAWQGEGMGFRPRQPTFWLNSLKRLPKLAGAMALPFYKPQLDVDK
jgi:hypothetical protein